MDNSIFKEIKNSISNKKFLNIGYLPRWIIFCIDVFIVMVANIITYFIITSLNVNFYTQLNVFYQNGIIVSVNALSFLLYRTYSGIIRHSTFIDGIKLLVATSTSYFILILFNFSFDFIYGSKLFL